MKRIYFTEPTRGNSPLPGLDARCQLAMANVFRAVGLDAQADDVFEWASSDAEHMGYRAAANAVGSEDVPPMLRGTELENSWRHGHEVHVDLHLHVHDVA